MHQIFDQLTKLTADLRRYLEPLADSLERLAKGVEPYLREIEPYLQGFVLYDAIAKARETTGWLPYRTIPFARYFQECGGSAEAFCAQVSSYYENHALEVVQDIASRLDDYAVDDEAKVTLREALDAHQYGLFRCVCRVLPPEIERVIREDWLAIHDVTSLKNTLFEGKINEKSLSDFVLDGSQDLVLFGLLAFHLFAWVNDRETIDQEPTPNRHAATHGWTPYSSAQSSLNAIICADYVFRLTTSFRATRREELTYGYGSQQ